MGKAFDMGNTQNSTGLPGDAPAPRTGSCTPGGKEDLARLWAEFAQLVVPPRGGILKIWWEFTLTENSCLPYHARAEGGQRFLKEGPLPLPNGQQLRKEIKGGAGDQWQT